MDFGQQYWAAAAVLGVFGACLWWLRRRGPAAAGRGGRRLTSIERLPLSAQHTLHLVRVDERAFLIASSPAGCAVLESFAASSGGARGER